ncbi:hypothetical protein AMTR_s00016p00259690 [Amborella trichopoda]|uniref:Pentatricopeptide repeat-containing protein n=2 Tax=Amborella trichopoda TaxID=13333 RepID=W1PH69_AMBTC|nr:hypothetical protein AMTR_s00016p00259690 [Amborella trichopoda]
MEVFDVVRCTMMITRYCRSGRIDDARRVFDRMPVQDVASYNAMIAGYFNSCHCCLEAAQTLFNEMPERNVITWTTMIDGLANRGEIEAARELFDVMPWRDAAAWNAMIGGYCRNARMGEAHALFIQMPDPDVISWTTVISGFERHGCHHKALFLFRDMLQAVVKPTSVTFACVLSACAGSGALQQGCQVHSHLVKDGSLISNVFVSTALVTMYACCQQMECSVKVFEESRHPRQRSNVALWTALLSGYGQNGCHQEALHVLCSMMRSGVQPNPSTFTSSLNSSTSLEDLERGKVIHAKAIVSRLEKDMFVSNSLVVMYSKCGTIDDALSVFSRMHKMNIVSWNSIIVGCAQHGRANNALQLFNQMGNTGELRADAITYIGVLTACSHAGLLHEGRCHFERLKRDPFVEMRIEHYVCMVDILGRCGQLQEAEEFINSMPPSMMMVNPNATSVWLALLSACRMHSNIKVGVRVATSIFDVDPCNTAAHVLLSNIYASAGDWDGVAQIRWAMKEKGVEKQPGHSWITVRNTSCKFLVGYTSHPMAREIYGILDSWSAALKELGYVYDRTSALA